MIHRIQQKYDLRVYIPSVGGGGGEGHGSGSRSLGELMLMVLSEDLGQSC